MAVDTVYSAPVPLQTSGWGANSFFLCLILPVFATIFVALRFWSRRVSHVRPQRSDWIMVAALLVYYALCGIGAAGIFYGGFGYNRDQLSVDTQMNASKILLIAENIYALSLGLAKIAALTLMLKVLGNSRKHRIAVWCTIALTIAWAVMAILISFLICRPLRYNWDYSTPGGYCGNEYAAFEAVAVVDIIVDIIILALPASVILKFHMPLTYRFAMITIFAFGFADIAAAALRLNGALLVNFSGNFTYTIGQLYFWSIFEPGLAIVVACFITLTPLLEHYFPGRFGSMRRKTMDSDSLPLSSSSGSETSSMKDDFFLALKKMDGTASVEFSCFAGEADRPMTLFGNARDEVNMRTDVILEQKISIA